MGMGFVYITASAMLPPWFSTRRNLAVGLSTSGAGIGGLAYSLATDRMIEELGVELAYRILAFCTLGVNFFASPLLKEWGGRIEVVCGQLPFTPKDFGRIEVLLIIIWGAVTDLAYVNMLYSLPTYASSIGLTSKQGSVSNALFNLGLAVGRPFIGHFSDTFGRINMAGAMTLLCTIFCFGLWIPAQSYGPLLAFSLFAGALCGTFWCTVTPVLAEVVGIKKMTSTFSVICLALVLPTTFAEPIALQMVKEDGSTDYIGAQIFVGFMFLAGALSLWLLRCWKIFDGLERRESLVPMTEKRRERRWMSWLKPRLLFSLGHV